MKFSRKTFKKKPFKKNIRKKRWIKKTNIGKAPRGLTQSTYLFKRQKTDVIQLANAALTDGWTNAGDNGIYKQFIFNLHQLTTAGTSDFTNLFKRYKICGIKVELTFNSNDVVISSLDAAESNLPPGCQLQVYTTPNRSGRPRS